MIGEVLVRFVRLPHGHGLPLPGRATSQAAGLDLAAALPDDAPAMLAPLDRLLVPTGFVVLLPAGHEGQVRPRSGLAARDGVTVLNAPGTIDADYRGELQVLLVNLSSEAVRIARGMRIAQLVVAPVAAVTAIEVGRDAIDSTSRGASGFGSTGR